MSTLSTNWWFWIPTCIGFALAIAFYLTSQFESKKPVYILIHKFTGIVPKLTLGTGLLGTAGPAISKFGIKFNDDVITNGLVLSIFVLSSSALIISIFVQMTFDSKRTTKDRVDVIEVKNNHILGFNGAAFALAVSAIFIGIITVLRIAAVYNPSQGG